jgi:hypothetical protein
MARILSQAATVRRLRFQFSRSAPSLTIKRRSSAQRTEAPESVDIRKRLPPVTH